MSPRAFALSRAALRDSIPRRTNFHQLTIEMAAIFIMGESEL
jgi:hypothetical protein